MASEVTNRIVLPTEFNEDQRSNFADAPSFLAIWHCFSDALPLVPWGRLQVEVFGVKGDVPGRFTKGIFWFDQFLKRGDSFCFPVLLDDSFCSPPAR